MDLEMFKFRRKPVFERAVRRMGKECEHRLLSLSWEIGDEKRKLCCRACEVRWTECRKEIPRSPPSPFKRRNLSRWRTFSRLTTSKPSTPLSCLEKTDSPMIPLRNVLFKRFNLHPETLILFNCVVIWNFVFCNVEAVSLIWFFF